MYSLTFFFFHLRVGGISFQEFSTGLRKLTHASDTSPTQVTPGDFEAFISISSEKGYLEPWRSSLQKQKKMLVLSDNKRLTRNAARAAAALFLHVFSSQS